MYPLQFKIIQREQQSDTNLIRAEKLNKDYTINSFHGGGKICVG